MQPVKHSVMDVPLEGEYVSFEHSLMALPTELHLQISSYLSYPDALALKHTCRHFYYLVYTGVHLKVDWLVERFERKLECPMEKCSFRTDEFAIQESGESWNADDDIWSVLEEEEDV